MKKSKLLILALTMTMLTTGCSVGFNIGNDGSDYAKEQNEEKQEATYSVDSNDLGTLTETNESTVQTVEETDSVTSLQSEDTYINYSFDLPTKMLGERTTGNSNGTSYVMYTLNNNNSLMILSSALLDNSYSIEEHMQITEEQNSVVIDNTIDRNSEDDVLKEYTPNGKYYMYMQNATGTAKTNLKDVISTGDEINIRYYVLVDENNYNAAIIELYTPLSNSITDLVTNYIQDTFEFTQTYNQNDILDQSSISTDSSDSTVNNDTESSKIYTIESYDGKNSVDIILGDNLKVSVSNDNIVCAVDENNTTTAFTYGHINGINELLASSSQTYQYDTHTLYTLIGVNNYAYCVKVIYSFDDGAKCDYYYVDTIDGELNIKVTFSKLDLSDDVVLKKLDDLLQNISYR